MRGLHRLERPPPVRAASPTGTVTDHLCSQHHGSGHAEPATDAHAARRCGQQYVQPSAQLLPFQLRLCERMIVVAACMSCGMLRHVSCRGLPLPRRTAVLHHCPAATACWLRLRPRPRRGRDLLRRPPPPQHTHTRRHACAHTHQPERKPHSVLYYGQRHQVDAANDAQLEVDVGDAQ
eukprot:365122-Chlamydomonas_euryale.AAC.54